MVFKVDKKTGFRTMDKIVRVYDKRGTLFYFRNPDKFPFTFNLPRGEYITTNTLKVCEPRRYKLPQLPRRERSNQIPKRVKLTFGNNPHKASIYIDKHLIIFDYELRNLSIPQQRQVFYHELGHYHYKTESFCDLFAVRRMLIEGFNPSQCYYSIKGTLNESPSSHYRKEYILQNCNEA